MCVCISCIMCIWKMCIWSRFASLNVFPAKTAIRYFIHSCLIDMCFVALPLTFLVVFLVNPYKLEPCFRLTIRKTIFSYGQEVLRISEV